jgi:hypothetical protein
MFSRLKRDLGSHGDDGPDLALFGPPARFTTRLQVPGVANLASMHQPFRASRTRLALTRPDFPRMRLSGRISTSRRELPGILTEVFFVEIKRGQP